jgi:hypothetical protein
MKRWRKEGEGEEADRQRERKERQVESKRSGYKSNQQDWEEKKKIRRTKER